MKETLLKHQEKGINRVAFGDIFLEDLKKYREENLSKIGMKAIFPVWKRDTAELVKTFIGLGFKAVVVCLDPKVLDPSFAGRVIDERFLHQLLAAVDPCGENGEFHSFVYDGPILRKRVEFSVGEMVLRDSFYFCDLAPDE